MSCREGGRRREREGEGGRLKKRERRREGKGGKSRERGEEVGEGEKEGRRGREREEREEGEAGRGGGRRAKKAINKRAIHGSQLQEHMKEEGGDGVKYSAIVRTSGVQFSWLL